MDRFFESKKTEENNNEASLPEQDEKEQPGNNLPDATGRLPESGETHPDLRPDLRKNAKNIMETILDKMGMGGEVFQKETNDSIHLNIDSEFGGLLIGTKGQTLDSLEHILNKICFAGNVAASKRIFIDVEDYRKKREEEIISLAGKIAKKVAEKGQPECMRPLNPRERKIVHTFLHDHPEVQTRSEGEGFYKTIILSYKGK